MITIQESICNFESAIERNNQFIAQRQAENESLATNLTFLKKLAEQFGDLYDCDKAHERLLEFYQDYHPD